MGFGRKPPPRPLGLVHQSQCSKDVGISTQDSLGTGYRFCILKSFLGSPLGSNRGGRPGGRLPAGALRRPWFRAVGGLESLITPALSLVVVHLRWLMPSGSLSKGAFNRASGTFISNCGGDRMVRSGGPAKPRISRPWLCALGRSAGSSQRRDYLGPDGVGCCATRP